MKALPSQEYLQECFTYNSDSGLLHWKERPRKHFSHLEENKIDHWKMWNGKFALKEAFYSINNSGYACGTLLESVWLSHRIIYKLMTGKDPQFIDHIDGNRLNNKFSNLRSVSRKENQQNQKKRSDNRSGVSGISWDNSRNKWIARIRNEDTLEFLGRFDNFENAVKARKIREKELNYHENHGRN